MSPLFNERSFITGSHDLDDDRWALFNLDEDFSEACDLSAVEPAKAPHVQELWWAEAEPQPGAPHVGGGQSGAGIHPGEYPPPEVATYSPGGRICEAAAADDRRLHGDSRA